MKQRSPAKPTPEKKTFRGLGWLDNFQQRHSAIGFSYAVQKKYGDDEAGYQAALVTYYGFLSIFPLLVVAMSIAQLAALHSLHFKATITQLMNRYFPLLGSQLQNSVHAQRKAGIALAVSLIVTLYGAQGVARAFQYVVNHMWQVPKQERSSGLKATLRSLGIIVLGGLGFMIAGILSGYATSLGRGVILRILAIIISLIWTYGVLMLVFKLSLSPKRSPKDLAIGTWIAAIGLQVVQIAGGFLITHELKNLNQLYGSFAIVLGILFWIYLLCRIVMYAMEVNTVRKLRLWPRSLVSSTLTEGDKRALRLYAKRERLVAQAYEQITVKFPD